MRHLFLVLLFSTYGCGGGAPCGGMCAADETCSPMRTCIPILPDPVCGASAPWSAGVQVFHESTDAFGLTGVEGVRLTVTDIDADGWADLEVRRGTRGIDDFADPTMRFTWLLHNDRNGHFEDVTESSGLLARRNGAGGRPIDVVAWGDVDNDGDLDVYTGVSTLDPTTVGSETSEVLLNDGSGHFTLTGADNPIRAPDDVTVPAGASFTDVDRDGFVDLWVPQYSSDTAISIFPHQAQLWRGDGTGRFTDATDALGLTTTDWSDQSALNMGLADPRAWSALACDLNGDGSPELLAASYGRMPNHLSQARPGPPLTYENRSVASGYAYDADMTWQDNQFARCFCTANPTADGCAGLPASLLDCSMPNWNDATDRQPWRLGGNSATTVCGDVDNDGDFDLLTSEIRHWWAGSGSDMAELLLNDGSADPVFTRPGRMASGLIVPHADPVQWDEGIMTAALFDFDDDGWLDAYWGGSDYPGNHGLLYHQHAPALFEAVPIAQGIDHHRSHGVVVADFDRDGDVDVIVGHSRFRCDASAPDDCYPTAQIRFFENVMTPRGGFIELALQGTGATNRAAIGARVRVTAASVSQMQEVEGGHAHFGSQNDRVLHFGLAGACMAEVEVRWPDAALSVEHFTLPAGHRYAITQGALPRESLRNP